MNGLLLLGKQMIEHILGDGLRVLMGVKTFRLEGIDIRVASDSILEYRRSFLHPLKISIVAVEVVVVLDRLEVSVFLQGRQHWH
jgi:hypothetical protein